MRQRNSMELYPLTMCYFIKRAQKCSKLFFDHHKTIKFHDFQFIPVYLAVSRHLCRVLSVACLV